MRAVLVAHDSAANRCTSFHRPSPLRPRREPTPVSNLQPLCLAPPRAEPSSCAYGCLRREAYTHVLIALRAARPARQIETSRSQMDVGSQFSPSQQALVRARASGRRTQKSRKPNYNVIGEVKVLAFYALPALRAPPALRGVRVRLPKPRVLAAAFHG